MLQSPATRSAPPPYFGGAHQPATPTPNFSPSSHHSPAGDNATGGESSKRRRIARACDMCRKKKIKCDGKQPACTHCGNNKTECIFTVVEKKRNPPKGAKYIEGLENRLNRMESLLRLSGILNDGDEQMDLGDLERRLQQSTTSSQRGASQPAPSSSDSTQDTPTTTSHDDSPKNPKSDEDVAALSEQMCSLVTDNCGEARFIGSSSGFSIFSQKGIEWVNEKTGDDSFIRMIQRIPIPGSHESSGWKDLLFKKLFSKQGREPPPPKEKALKLVNADFFNGFNCLFPLFHKKTFDQLFERQYSDNPPTDSGWYAVFNIVLAIASRLRMSHTPCEDDGMTPEMHMEAAWDYFQNGASVMLELLMKNSNLLSIQAIVGMALYLQGSSNPQMSFFLVAAAVRVATSVGIHRRGNVFGLSASEIEQRRRIFWIIYLMDKDLALRSGRPPCLNDDDCNVDLPDDNPEDGYGLVPLMKEKRTFNIFGSMSRFSIIQSKVYMQLYSAKASRQTDGELLQAIGRLDKELEDWRSSLPAEFRPENETSLQHPNGLLLHVVILQFAYYNCLTTIHRMSIHHGYWSNRLSDYAIAGLSIQPLNPRVFSSASLCVSAARATVRLIEYINPKDSSCIWLVMYYPVSALVTLFANVIQNPQDPRGRSDLHLIDTIIDFLTAVIKVDHVDEAKMSDDVDRMLIVCGEFRRIAERVLEKAERDNTSRRKRKFNGDTPLTARPSSNASSHTKKIPTTDPSTSTASAPSDPRERIPNGVNPQQVFNGTLEQPLTPGTSLSWAPDTIQTPNSIPPFSPDTNGTLANPAPLLPPSTHQHTFTDLQSPTTGIVPTFDQPFIPQDMWQMPMTFDWDWDTFMGGMTTWDHDGPDMSPPGM
ncbi:hypothetical protein EX30DRAFT_309201 [Ascodesmis nigricans]|uniref:Zn(2)-C6 fungal-type domain-containing protein n=1 Tax=Ascodesmis nigricans TaxID=341454 RepID=A0A4V6RHD0_9PEZI|nr:hypothetical protein EX30DRAFT_309201 [Ascodesmis nigricans]